jgi:serine/threonine protein phosphatase PrpC
LEKLQVEFGGFSSQGIKDENQDAFAAWMPEGETLNNKGAVAVIADGVSACARGREAAVTCVTSFIRDYSQTADTLTVKRAASKVLHSLNRWCHGQHEYDQGGHSQMITTLSSIIFKSTTAFIFHTGDSRISRFQDGLFEQLTSDHHARLGTNRVLTRAIGIEAHLEVDFSSVELCLDDLFMLSTDGLHEFLTAKYIQQRLNDWRQHKNCSLEILAKSLVEEALAAGSDDNITCLFVRVNALPEAQLNEYHRQLTRLAMPPALDVGMMLEGFRVIDVVFNGTRSSLYKVVDESNGKVFGMKTPSQHFADDPLYLSGFLREEWVGRRIKHPGVMQIFARPDNAKFMYHICEYIEGQTLRQWMLDNPKPSILQVRSIIGQLIKAVRAMQRQDMVHRDIKPENIMITPKGEVKLIDFGAVLVAALAETHQLNDETVPLGAVNYIAPEYLLAQQSDHRSDLFSLAVVCYEMLSGQLPFASLANLNVMPKSLANWDYVSLRKHRPDLPQWLDLALAKALKTNPDKRYQAFSEFLLDISQPNYSMLKAVQNQPLIERNPLLLYQIICVVQFVVIVVLISF